MASLSASSRPLAITLEGMAIMTNLSAGQASSVPLHHQPSPRSTAAVVVYTARSRNGLYEGMFHG